LEKDVVQSLFLLFCPTTIHPQHYSTILRLCLMCRMQFNH